MERNEQIENQRSCYEELHERNVGLCTCLRRFLSKGILFALSGTVLLAGGDICGKLLTQSMSPPAVIASFSSITAVVSLIFTALLKVPLPCFRTILFVLLPCNVAALVCRIFLLGALSRLPVGDAISIFYTTPIFTAFFGWILLKQPLKISDFFFSFTCIVGVVFVTQPSFIFGQIIDGASKIDTVGIMFAVGGAFCNALFIISVRRSTDLEIHNAVIITTTQWAHFMANSLLCTVLGEWKLPEPLYYTAFIPLYALCILLASFCIFSAVARERAVYVTVILTFEIVLVYLFQSLSTNAVPHWLTVTGAVAVIVSCVGMAFRENSHDDE